MATQATSLPTVFEAAKATFPNSLGPDIWYLVAASSLITNTNPGNFGQLWLYLKSQPEYQTLEQRRTLNARLREFIMKQWVTIGVPKAAIALFSLVKEEKEGEANLAFTKESVQINPQTREKGTKFLSYLYSTQQMEAMWSSWGQDFEWLCKDIVYGMFYGDNMVLSDLETEMITYTAIVSQDLGATVPNHLGGLLGMGLTLEQVEGVTACGRIVADGCGVDTKCWPDVRAVAATLEKRGDHKWWND